MPIAKPCSTIFLYLGTFAYVFLFFFGGALGEEFAGEQIHISRCCTVPCKYRIKDIQAFIIFYKNLDHSYGFIMALNYYDFYILGFEADM